MLVEGIDASDVKPLGHGTICERWKRRLYVGESTLHIASGQTHLLRKWTCASVHSVAQRQRGGGRLRLCRIPEYSVCFATSTWLLSNTTPIHPRVCRALLSMSRPKLDALATAGKYVFRLVNHTLSSGAQYAAG
ncbi:hypothetical protein DENSPDRAFT_77966 [Dentipellis sp. KUC8613]|nr:hypothetical protein DENSPDRAFT_77966 [Dentipellis sp. KUC8613]